MNKVILMGYMTREVEVKTTSTGKTYARIGLAVNRPKRKGEEKPQADFFNVIAWGQTAEFCGRYLTKGSLIDVEGLLRANSYEQDGEKKYSLDIWAEKINAYNTKGKSEQPKKEQPSEISDEQIPFF